MEGATIGIEKSAEKRKLRSSIAFSKATSLEKDGKCVSKDKIKKRSDMAEIRWNKDVTKSDAKEKLRDDNASWKNIFTKRKKKKEDEILDLQDNKFNAEDEKDMRNKERILKSLKKSIGRH